MNYGIQLFSLRKYLKNSSDYRKVFARAKDLGAQTVQLSATMGFVPEASLIKELSNEFSLPICCSHSPFSRIENDLDNLAKEHLEYSCKVMGIGMMPKRFRTGKLQDLLSFISIVNKSAESLSKYGIKIAYHNHWFEFDEIEGKTIFDRLIDDTLPDVEFIPDTFWIKVGKNDPATFLKKLEGRVSTIHLKDYCKILNLPIFRAVGKGNLDFIDIIDTATSIGAKNAVVELDFSPNPWKSIETSLDFLVQQRLLLK